MFAWFRKKASTPPKGPVPDHHVALFAPDGSLTAFSGAAASALSPRWKDFWRRMLDAHGPVFKAAIPIPPLSHIGVRLTRMDGAALVSFTVQGQPVTSAVALTGQHSDSEAEVLQMFVDSLRRTQLVRAYASDKPPFEEMFRLSQRPLYIAVIWGNPAVNDEDHETVIEFESHLAAVLLTDP
jgi:hypothetical protein